MRVSLRLVTPFKSQLNKVWLTVSKAIEFIVKLSLRKSGLPIVTLDRFLTLGLEGVDNCSIESLQDQELHLETKSLGGNTLFSETGPVAADLQPQSKLIAYKEP